MSDKSKKHGSANDKPRVFSLNDLKNAEEECSSEDEKQTYYAGGEKSGTAVQGGGRKSGNQHGEAHEIMSKIFEQASSETPVKNQKTYNFSGSGRKLNDLKNYEKSKNTAKMDEPEIVTVNLIFWNDGFSIGEGPLRGYNEPEAVSLLERINSGSVTANDLGIGPFELADVKITQISGEKFSKAKRSEIIGSSSGSRNDQPKGPTFVGTGEKLGQNEIKVIEIKEDAQLDPKIDQTRIQVVLPNGSRKVISLSARAKITDLYQRVKEETKLENFSLQTGNPARSIPESLDANIFQIGLLNSSIILK